MQDYYEILDAQYWRPAQKVEIPDTPSPAKKLSSGRFFKAIALMILALLCWQFSDWPGVRPSWALNLTGFILGLWSYFTIYKFPRVMHTA